MTLIPATTRRLDPWRWLGLPSLICVVATLLFSAPIRLFGLAPPEPVFPLTLAFAWAVIRPSMLAPFILLLLGLFLDLWWGGPLGLWAVCLLVSYGVTLGVRRVLSGLGWWGLGGWYVVATSAAMGAGVLLTAMMTDAPPDLLAVAWQGLACLALFPFAHRLIERFEDADVRFR
jgi:rod shape-determining protein MreD